MRFPGPAVLLAAAACLSPPDRAAPQGKDAAPGARDAASTTCAPGAIISPADVFAGGPNPDEVCGVEQVLDRDGVSAGLDRMATSSCDAWSEGSEACSCAVLDLGAVMPVATLTVVAAATGDACGLFACLEVDDGCGTGHDFTAWYGAGPDEHIHAGDLDLPGDGEPIQHVIVVDAGVRYVSVCRNGWGEGRDDVAIDSIEVVCGD